MGTSGTDDFSHGFFVIGFAGYLAWRKRRDISRLTPTPSYLWGVLFLVCATTLLAIGKLASASILEQVSLLPMLAGLILLILGRQYLRLLGLPLAYLIFMIPFDDIVDQLHWPLQLLSATIAALLLPLFGIPVLHENIYLHLPRITLEVAEVCSGVRYLVSIVAIGVPLAYLTQAAWQRRLAVVGFAIGAAIAANGFRVALIGVWSHYVGGNILHGPSHILTGVFVSWIGFGAVFFAAWLLGRQTADSAAAKRFAPNIVPGSFVAHPVAADASGSSSPLPRSTILACGIAVLALLAGAAMFHLHRPVSVPPVKPLGLLPWALGPWNAQPPASSPPFPLRVTKADDHVMRLYRNAGGQTLNLYVAYYADQDREKKLADFDTRTLVREAKRVAGPSGDIGRTSLIWERKRYIVYYWFEVNGQTTTSRLTARVLSAWNGLAYGRNNGALVFVYREADRQGSDGLPADDDIGFIRELIPVLRTHLPHNMAAAEPSRQALTSFTIPPISPWIFWLSFGLVLYIYIGYPAIAMILGWVFNRQIHKADCAPRVSIVIAAYNEEGCIRETIQDKLRLDYEPGLLEILVVSDASTDHTDAIVEEFAPHGVRLLRQPIRQVKTVALNRAIQEARGEIIVFADANSLYSPDALRHLMACFADPAVGYVTGRAVFAHAAGAVVGKGGSAFIRYETLLRQAETRLGSVVGVNGGIDAVRKSLYTPMRADQQPDFVLPLRVVQQGYRVVHEPRACLTEHSLVLPQDEYSMRVRVTIRALRAIWDMKLLLNPFQWGLYSLQVWSHKVLRYFAFAPLIVLYASSLLLAPTHPFYAVGSLFQTLLYACAVLGWVWGRKGGRVGPLFAPFYFALTTVACAHAFLRLLTGATMTTWTPRRA
jgi:EpsI family protein